MLGVTRLIDLLGDEECLLVLVGRGEDQSGELVGHALLADEEGRQAEEHLLAQALGHGIPVAPVGAQVDLVRDPVLALPQPVELERSHELDLAEPRRVAQRGDIALHGQIKQTRHAPLLAWKEAESNARSSGRRPVDASQHAERAGTP